MGRRWQADGLCVGVDPTLFFPDLGESSEEAKAVCAECRIKERCRDWGIRHERDGIWGGLAEQERRVIRRKHGIKVEVPGLPVVASCGTVAGYRKHYRQGTPVCQACREANSRGVMGRRARGAA